MKAYWILREVVKSIVVCSTYLTFFHLRNKYRYVFQREIVGSHDVLRQKSQLLEEDAWETEAARAASK